MRTLDRLGVSWVAALALAGCGGKATAIDDRDAALAPASSSTSAAPSSVEPIGSLTTAPQATFAPPDASSPPENDAGPLASSSYSSAPIDAAPSLDDSSSDAAAPDATAPDAAVSDAAALGSALPLDGSAGECAGAFPLHCGDNFRHSTGIQGRANVWGGYGTSQRAESGPETLYVLQAPAGCQVVASISGLKVDLDLFLMTSCEWGADVQASTTPLDLQALESLEFATQPDQEYIVVVDGYSGAWGSYEMNVACDCE